MLLKRLITIYLPMTVVLAVATWAGVQLYQDRDPELNTVEFVTAATFNDNTNVELQMAQNETEGTAVPSEPHAEEATASTDTTATSDVKTVQALPVSNSQPTHTELPAADDTTATEPNVESEIVVTLSGPGVTKRCEVPVTGSVLVHALMQQASKQCHFSYQVKDFTSLGAFVDELGGLTSDRKEGKYWIYYVNGKKANIGVSAYTAQPNDVVAWVYEQEY